MIMSGLLLLSSVSGLVTISVAQAVAGAPPDRPHTESGIAVSESHIAFYFAGEDSRYLSLMSLSDRDTVSTVEFDRSIRDLSLQCNAIIGAASDDGIRFQHLFVFDLSEGEVSYFSPGIGDRVAKPFFENHCQQLGFSYEENRFWRVGALNLDTGVIESEPAPLSAARIDRVVALEGVGRLFITNQDVIIPGVRNVAIEHPMDLLYLNTASASDDRKLLGFLSNEGAPPREVWGGRLDRLVGMLDESVAIIEVTRNFFARSAALTNYFCVEIHSFQQEEHRCNYSSVSDYLGRSSPSHDGTIAFLYREEILLARPDGSLEELPVAREPQRGRTRNIDHSAQSKD
jgi:hypothetical protein